MQSYADQAFVALEYYLVRGKMLVECLNRKEFDKIMDIQQKRNFAFHNFRVADALLQKSGTEVTQLKEYKDLWHQILKVDEELAGILSLHKAQTLEEITKTREFAAKISRYRSGKTPDPDFKQIV
jgi:hypothetical protein